jgi:general secretion pathway protein D
LAIALLTSCEKRQALPDPFDTIENVNLEPHFPQQLGHPPQPPKPMQGASFYGREATVVEAAPAQAAADTGDGYDLNFENAAVATVAKVILGDILGTGYTIDPRVQGTVTIASGRPVPKSNLIPVLENALRMSNVVLVAGDGGYRLIPSGDAQGTGATMRAGANGEGGYGITAVPLRYTAAPTILKLLDSFAVKPGSARADVGNNLILVQGTGPERKTAVDAILSFDVDWMRGRSVGIYPVENATPDAIIKELQKIMESGEGGLAQNLVTLQPIARLNAIMVVTQKPAMLKAAATWIARLDKSDNAGAAVRVYRLSYADARQVAKVLSDLFGSRSGGLDSAANQIAPGAGVTGTSSDVLGSMTNTGSPFTTNPPAAGSAPGGTGSGVGPLLGAQSSPLSGVGGGGIGQGAGGAVGGAANALGGAAGQGASINIPGLRITADVANNSLVIFANQENYRLIEQTLAQLDRPQLQVAIHATIAEVTLNNDLQYGVEYFVQGAAATFGFSTTSSSTSTAGGTIGNPLGPIYPGANLLIGAPGNPAIVINALRSITDVKVLSSPSLVVMDNQIASLQVGDQVPVTTESAAVLTNPTTPLVNTVNYLNTGVILTVAPRVNVNGNVVLDISQEVSNVENTTSTPNLTPTIAQRKIKSSVSVASGQTVLLGGLISETHSRSRQGIPVLEEIPWLGQLASVNDRSTMRTELIVFIQPQIIRDSVDAYKVAEELRAKLRGSAEAAFQPGPSLRSDPRFAQ